MSFPQPFPFLSSSVPPSLPPSLILSFIIVDEADQILKNEQQLLRLPGEPLSVELVDRERLKQK